MTDQEDFAAVLREFGLTAEQMRYAEKLGPWILCACPNLRVLPSKIEGMGVFAQCSFIAGQVITVAIAKRERRRHWTIHGRYTNHARVPNARAELHGGQLLFIAKVAIRNGDEITVDYRQVRRALEAKLQPKLEVAS